MPLICSQTVVCSHPNRLSVPVDAPLLPGQKSFWHVFHGTRKTLAVDLACSKHQYSLRAPVRRVLFFNSHVDPCGLAEQIWCRDGCVAAAQTRLTSCPTCPEQPFRIS